VIITPYTTFIKKAKYIGLCLFFSLFLYPLAAQTKPNIIIVLADDLGYGDLGCFGSKIIKTPHLDKLATEGVRLTQFYSGSTVCAPSRCAMLTGRHMGTAYIRGNGEYPLRKKDVILPQILKKAGYSTALFGKWGLGDINTEGMPHLKGWDTFFGFLHHIEAHYQRPSIAWRSSPDAPMPKRVAFEFLGYGADQFANAAIDWLKKQDAQKPFFMEFAVPLPHAELLAPAEAMKPYLDEKGNSIFNEKPYETIHYGGQTKPKATYAAMVSLTDEYVGRIVATLKEKGLDKNTIIIFTSDNGTHTEGGRTMDDVKFMQSSGILRGVKRDLYEGGIRVPTVVWGADLPKGVERDGQGAFWDLLPTFVDMAGIKKKISTDGISLYNHWKTGDKLPERPLYWEFYERNFMQAIRLGDWKFIQMTDKNNAIKTELFDLKTDINEAKDLSATQPQQVAVMQGLLVKLRSKPELSAFLWNGK
jgi:arylsulfatase A-like enzyme